VDCQTQSDAERCIVLVNGRTYKSSAQSTPFTLKVTKAVDPEKQFQDIQRIVEDLAVHPLTKYAESTIRIDNLSSTVTEYYLEEYAKHF